MTASLLDRVRAGCKEVASRAAFVHIDVPRIELYALSLPLQQARLPEFDLRYHFAGDRDDTIAYVITLDAINFGSGYFPELRKRPNLSGYFTIASSLTDRFRARGPFPAQELIRLRAEDCAVIFGQDLDGGARSELMGLFASALNDLGDFLMERFDGRFSAVLEEAGDSAERLVQILAEMRYFQDVAPYDGMEVPFYKRAQLTGADISLALGGNEAPFRDLDRLTIFADNLVPHVLRADGVLRYAGSLASRVDSLELIPAGSRAEIEIRACAVDAVERMVAHLRDRGQPVTAMGLDYLLWNRGQQPSYKARPRHRTRTVFY